jgi:hypothetical protein
MIKKLLAILALFSLLLAMGCASVPMESADKDAAAKTYAVAPGKANIYVYRNETFGAAIRMPVVLNGRLVGDTASKTYYKVEVAPGAYTVVSKTENDAVVKLNAVAGRNYYVWQEVKMGMFAAGSALHEVDEATGRAGIAECMLATPYQ